MTVKITFTKILHIKVKFSDVSIDYINQSWPSFLTPILTKKMVGSKILVFFVSTLIVSVVSDDCFDYGTDYFGFDLGQDHLVSFMQLANRRTEVQQRCVLPVSFPVDLLLCQ